jgi:hypothetical protein
MASNVAGVSVAVVWNRGRHDNHAVLGGLAGRAHRTEGERYGADPSEEQGAMALKGFFPVDHS